MLKIFDQHTREWKGHFPDAHIKFRELTTGINVYQGLSWPQPFE